MLDKPMIKGDSIFTRISYCLFASLLFLLVSSLYFIKEPHISILDNTFIQTKLQLIKRGDI